ncbi:hypothetical protein ACN28E_08170 [Archangium lansingense]|uniref:hypothetical protein n=1 Tax=Archangium lansingense TaxID=2995310 RepID=UPI003B7ED060
MKGPSTFPARCAGALLAALVATSAWAQAPSPSPDQAQAEPVGVGRPTASHGGKAELVPPRPVAESDDPVNKRVAADTVDGVVLAITIDGNSVTLDAVAPARVPRRLARPNRDPVGDRVKVTGLIADKVVATTIVPDNVLNASEGDGVVRTTRRQIAVVLATDQPLDTVVVEAPATGAKASLDVRAAYARICQADPRNKWCPGQPQP